MVWEKGGGSGSSMYARYKLKLLLKKLEAAKQRKENALARWRKNQTKQAANNYYMYENKIIKYAEKLRNKYGHVNSTLKNPERGTYYHRNTINESNKSVYERQLNNLRVRHNRNLDPLKNYLKAIIRGKYPGNVNSQERKRVHAVKVFANLAKKQKLNGLLPNINKELRNAAKVYAKKRPNIRKELRNAAKKLPNIRNAQPNTNNLWNRAEAYASNFRSLTNPIKNRPSLTKRGGFIVPPHQRIRNENLLKSLKNLKSANIVKFYNIVKKSKNAFSYPEPHKYPGPEPYKKRKELVKAINNFEKNLIKKLNNTNTNVKLHNFLTVSKTLLNRKLYNIRSENIIMNSFKPLRNTYYTWINRHGVPRKPFYFTTQSTQKQLENKASAEYFRNRRHFLINYGFIPRRGTYVKHPLSRQLIPLNQIKRINTNAERRNIIKKIQRVL